MLFIAKQCWRNGASFVVIIQLIDDAACGADSAAYSSVTTRAEKFYCGFAAHPFRSAAAHRPTPDQIRGRLFPIKGKERRLVPHLALDGRGGLRRSRKTEWVRAVGALKQRLDLRAQLFRRILRAKALDDIALAIDEEFGEVPLDRL